MLFDPRILLEEPLRVLAVVGIIVVGKSLAAALVVVLFRYPLGTALTVSASLAQIGEFSFILVALGVSLKLLPPEGQSLVVAGALISMALNPLLFSLVEPLQRWICERSALARRLQARDDPLATLPTNTADNFLAQQVVLVGYGRVGRHIAAALAEQGQAFVVADHNRERVAQLRAAGIAAVHGDATDPAVLIQAHIAQARLLVIATAASVDARPMIETARTLNPSIQTVVRALSDEEAQRLQADGAVQALVAETELARAVVQRVQTTLQTSALKTAAH